MLLNHGCIMYNNCSTSEHTLNSIMLSSDIITSTATTRNNSLQLYSTMSTDHPSIFISSSLDPLVVLSPCAACKMLRRRCDNLCMLAPYFPPTNPLKFATAHRVFGASNIIKLLQVIILILLFVLGIFSVVELILNYNWLDSGYAWWHELYIKRATRKMHPMDHTVAHYEIKRHE